MGGFGEGLGRVWGGFWEGFGKVWEPFGRSRAFSALILDFAGLCWPFLAFSCSSLPFLVFPSLFSPLLAFAGLCLVLTRVIIAGGERSSLVLSLGFPCLPMPCWRTLAFPAFSRLCWPLLGFNACYYCWGRAKRASKASERSSLMLSLGFPCLPMLLLAHPCFLLLSVASLLCMLSGIFF